jgi:hypothetical protein
VKQILSRKNRIRAATPSEQQSFSEVVGMTERLRQNLRFACVQEDFLAFQLHGLLDDRRLADQLLADWHLKFTEVEREEQRLRETQLSSQIVQPQRFRDYLQSYVNVCLELDHAYIQCSVALRDNKLGAAFSALCDFRRFKARQAQIAMSWLKYFPASAAPISPDLRGAA